MKKLALVLAIVFSVILPINVFADDLSIKFDSYGWYKDDVNKDGTMEKVWIVPVGGSYKVDKENSTVGMDSFTLSYTVVDVMPEPMYVKGKPVYVQCIDIGTKKGLEWYGPLTTFVGSGTYEGPDTEYYFDRTEMIYVGMGDNSDSMSFSDLAAGIFSGNYPMTDPIPKDIYCLTAMKKDTSEDFKSWYFKVLPYEYAAPANIKAKVCGSDLTFNAYNIKGYNYFKIRDLAAAFKDTGYAFSVEWSNMGIRIRRGQESIDEISGGSMAKGYAKATHSYGGVITLDDDEYASKSVECYNINGYNYYKIRDIADLLGFDVNYDSTTGKIECK